MTMNRVIRLWNRQTFAKQLTLVFMGVFLFQLFIVEGIGSNYLKQVIKEKIEESYQIALKQTAHSTESSLQMYKNGIDEMFRDSDFILTVEALDDIEHGDEWKIKSDLEQIMKEFMAYRSEVRSVCVRTKNGSTYTYDRQKVELLNPVTAQLLENYFESRIFEDNQGLKGKWVPTAYYDTNGTRKNYVFSYGKQIMEWYTTRQIGVGIISIDEEVLNNICQDALINKDNKINTVMMTDQSGTIISHPNKSYIGKNLESYREDLPMEDWLVIREEITDTGWQLVSVLSKDYVYHRLYEVQNLILIISLLLAVVVLFIIFYVSKKMSKYITDIVDTMNKVQSGKLSAKVGIPQGEKNEISQIAIHFNIMMNTVNDQMRVIKESGEKQREAEIRALEAQINPHFIYNTLDSINWLAIENDEKEISNMLSKFGQILRYQIQKSNKVVLIEEELIYLEQYLFLQKVRFMDSFEYNIECQESVKKFQIHKMIFQPFIENAVIHGIGDIEYGGLIQISIRDHDQNHLSFIIDDNGQGMIEEQIEGIFVKRDNQTNSIGVSNVLARLDLYYGDEYKIHVKSGERGGTIIETIIPKWCKAKEMGDRNENTGC